MGARLRIAALVALAPVIAGAHCKEDCGPPAVRLVGARTLEHTMYTAGVLTPRALVGEPVRGSPNPSAGATLATALAPFERREIRVDVSRPVAVVLVEPRAARALARADGGKLAPGDHGEGYRVVAVVEQRAKVALLDDPAAVAEAERERYDAVLLVPRDRRAGPWEASVAVEVGRKIARRNDDSGKCVDEDRAAPALPEWSLVPLSPGCGDGVRSSDEDCDDGNTTAGDGCSPYCLRER